MAKAGIAPGLVTSKREVARAVIRLLVTILIMPLVLLGAAGRLGWGMAWVYIILTLLAMIGSRLLLLHGDPQLAAERAHGLVAQDAKPWDRKLMPFVAMWGPLAIMLVAGLDERLGWTTGVPWVLQVAGLLVIAGASALGSWAMLANRFFSSVVRIQRERGHQVTDHGPYASVRHPAYAGAVWMYLAMPLVFDALTAFVPALLVVAGVVLRTILEDRTLLAELPGYAAYARRVRYRLLPGVW